MRAQTNHRGTMLVELVLTLVIIAIVTAMAVPSVRTIADRMSLRRATHDVVLGLWAARNAATVRGDYVSFVLDAPAGRLRVVSGADTVYFRDLAARHGVTLDVTRDSITYAPNGIGYGAANTRIIVARGGKADTITTSRMGRVSF
jgi:Tfp pilus assembly protein FimT